MANASKKSMGQAVHGKRDGSGAMTSESIADGLLGANQVLSNRDKSQHSGTRGLDGKAVMTEQRQDHVANHERPPSPGDAIGGNASGMRSPMSTTSGQDSSLEIQKGSGHSDSLADPSGTISGAGH